MLLDQLASHVWRLVAQEMKGQQIEVEGILVSQGVAGYPILVLWVFSEL